MTEEKISVIIPTIQKCIPVLKKLVKLLSQDKVVSEILIINNKPEDLCGFESLKKVRILNQKENLYVNASWNLGIETITNDIFLIINDDILPVKNLCTLIYQSEILNKKMTGLIGISPQFINQHDRNSTSDIEIPQADEAHPEFLNLNKYQNTGDWGSAFFGRKKNYYRIPNELKIIYGDNYLLFMNFQNAKMNYQIAGLPFNHIHSLSSAAPEFWNIVQNDMQNASKYIR